MSADATIYPHVVDPAKVGEYPASVFAGGGYVWDEVLEYRVWCHPERGAPRDDRALLVRPHRHAGAGAEARQAQPHAQPEQGHRQPQLRQGVGAGQQQVAEQRQRRSDLQQTQRPPAETLGHDPVSQALGRYNVTLGAAQNQRSYQPPQVWSVFANYSLGHGFDVSLGTSRQGSFPASAVLDIKLPAAQTFSGSIGYTSRTWDVRLSGKNLTDVLYFQSNSGSAGSIPNVGRAFDIKTTWKF